MDNNFLKHINWRVQIEIYPLFKFIIPMFEKIFGKEIMNRESCEVYIDIAYTPTPIITFNPTRIIINATSIYWCQVIFQLAHELTHYAIRQKTNYQFRNCAIAAFEEPVCEAMAMYILKLCAEQWNNCDYYKTDPNWGVNFEKYRIDIYNIINDTNRLSTYEQWKSLCEKYTVQNSPISQRPNVSAMRNYLYDTFVSMPDDIALLIEYPLYVRDKPYNLLIDINKWENERPLSSPFIKSICAIQPIVL